MDTIDIVAMLDKKYSGPDRIMCPNQGVPVMLKSVGKALEDHGHLCVHKSGSLLVCGLCGYSQAVGRV